MAERNSPAQRQSQLQAIINQLGQLQANTTLYPEAQSLLASAQKQLKQLQPS
ncbi:hypothetical protein [Trichothermofontia sp.]